MKEAEEIRDKLIELAISWGDALSIGDHRTVNRLNNAITKIAKQLPKDQCLGECILAPLFTHPNPSVRLFASVHTLEQNIQVEKAEIVLTQIAEDPNIGLVSLMAHINLSNWIKKKTSKIKGEPSD